MNLPIVLATFGIVIVHPISEAVFPALFDCCTEVAHHIPRRWLRTVAAFDIQNGGDLCKISAVIIHTKHKKLCVSPENRHVKRWMKQVAKGRWRTGHHPRKRKKAKKRRKSGRKEPCPSC
ncbi:C-C motif chemokine 28 [Lacerta agilis]|uniref:C-C motif chemokine 28 n=1 Tax=Lacerta agilis TaxID=80427 RepID=UPI0014199AEA|nr:C-C motif chemokine 28 [Lacerta agilis]